MKAGDKVVCVETGGKLLLNRGATYTVSCDPDQKGLISLEGFPGAWRGSRFRLINKDDTGDNMGRKDDTGKVRMELLNDMPRAIKGVAEVLHWAVTDKKPEPYVPGSWQYVPDYYARYTGALMRHQNNIATHGQFAKDAETNLLDLKHLACDILILLELTLREQEGKA